MQAGEGQRLGEIGLALGGGHRPPRVDLDHHMAVEGAPGEAFQQLGAGLRAPARHQVLVLRRPVAVGEVHVGQPVPHPVDHRGRVRTGGRGVRQVDGEVPVVVLRHVPLGRVGEHLAVAVPPRVHVLHGEPHVGLLRHPPDAGDELPRVLALPPERGMHDDGGRAEPLGRRPGALQLDPRIGGPHPLGDEQTGRVNGQDRHLVLVRQAAQRVDVLADRIRPHHDLDAVVSEARGDLEGGRRGLRIDGGGGQGDLRGGDADGFCHGDRVRGPRPPGT